MRRSRTLAPGGPRLIETIHTTVLVVASVAAATLATRAVEAGVGESMYVFYIAAIAVASWRGGAGAGIAATALGLTLSLLTPGMQPRGERANWHALVTPLSFAAVGLFIALLTAALRTARLEAEDLTVAAERERVDAERARQSAEDANAARNRFLAMMSHEFRTPLNAVLSYADLLEAEVAGPVMPAQREYLSRMRSAGLHLLTLVNDIIDLARMGAGRFEVNSETVALGDVASRAADLVHPQAKTKGVSLRVEPAGTAVLCDGDEGRLRQIVVNLLANAVKFTPPGGEVHLSWGHGTAQRGRPWLRVADTGPGIDPRDQERVFAPFEQAGTTGANRAGGTGLGLAISQNLARAMRGELQLDSEPGKGSTFTLWLDPPGARERRQREA